MADPGEDFSKYFENLAQEQAEEERHQEMLNAHEVRQKLKQSFFC